MTRNTQSCAYCGASIIEARGTRTSALLRLDTTPVPDGAYILNDDGQAVRLTEHDRPAADTPRYRPHLDHCERGLRGELL